MIILLLLIHFLTAYYWFGWVQGQRFQAAPSDAIVCSNRNHPFLHRLSPYIAGVIKSSPGALPSIDYKWEIVTFFY